MTYRVEVTRRAEGEILRLDDTTFERVQKAIDRLGRNPRPSGVRKLRGRDNVWRIRIGGFRILYTVEDAGRLIVIQRVTDRKDVYR